MQNAPPHPYNGADVITSNSGMVLCSHRNHPSELIVYKDGEQVAKIKVCPSITGVRYEPVEL